MAQESRLSAALTIKDIQSGFAGETGTVWTIAADFSFIVARQVGLKILEPHKTGQLSLQQQAHLKAVLDHVEMANLPTGAGNEPPVNARTIMLSYGGTDSVLTLPPGGGELRSLRAASADRSAAALLEIAGTIKEMTAG